MAHLTCDCGQEYEIRDDTPQWASPWIMCGQCLLTDRTVITRTDREAANE